MFTVYISCVFSLNPFLTKRKRKESQYSYCSVDSAPGRTHSIVYGLPYILYVYIAFPAEHSFFAGMFLCLKWVVQRGNRGGTSTPSMASSQNELLLGSRFRAVQWAAGWMQVVLGKCWKSEHGNPEEALCHGENAEHTLYRIVFFSLPDSVGSSWLIFVSTSTNATWQPPLSPHTAHVPI